jgi:hypothetical protein
MSAVHTGGGRSLKHKVLGLLQASDFENSLRELRLFPGRQVVNPLFSFLLHSDQEIRWRSVIAMGVVIEDLARTNIEDARVIIRRLMWSLNDESGGIGWGAPEVLGEVLARSDKLADEYSAILCSYADERGNFLEHEGLQQGLLWAWARLARVRPNVLKHAGALLSKYLESQNPAVRGLGAIAIGLVGVKDTVPRLQRLLQDNCKFITYIDEHISEMSVGEAASEALHMLSKNEAKG